MPFLPFLFGAVVGSTLTGLWSMLRDIEIAEEREEAERRKERENG